MLITDIPADTDVQAADIIAVELDGAARSAADQSPIALVELDPDPADLPRPTADGTTASPDNGKGKPGKIGWRPVWP